jgi:type IV pilus assembly protein PilA
MLQALRKRLHKDEEGFTLIELMVVVLIIAILIAIAIPTFLGARNRANSRAAQSSLRNALTAGKTIFTDGQDYTQATVAALGTAEPALSFAAAGVASTDFKTVSVATTTGTFAAAAWGKDNVCYYIYDQSGAGSGTTYGTTTVAADCTGTKAVAAAANSW